MAHDYRESALIVATNVATSSAKLLVGWPFFNSILQSIIPQNIWIPHKS